MVLVLSIYRTYISFKYTYIHTHTKFRMTTVIKLTLTTSP